MLGEMLRDARFAPVLRHLTYLYQELRELEARERELLDKINEIVRQHAPVRGTLVYKWVLNKVGKRYWYWYLHVKKGGRTRSIYLGKEIPRHIVEGIAARRHIRILERQLREVSRRRLELEQRLRSIFYRV